jgi:hypothetical protein
VDETRYSFPFTAAGHVVAQATFFLQHLPLAVAVGALAAAPAVRRNRAAHGALLTAAVGLVLLAVTEIVAMLAADVALDSTTATTVSSVYGLPTVLAGAGLAVAGIVGLRHPGTLPVPGWIVLALGLTVFVVLTPALASGGFVAGRLAIMVWMALFALLGWELQRSPARDGER